MASATASNHEATLPRAGDQCARPGGHRRAHRGLAITGPVIDTWLGTNFVAMLAQVGWGVARFDETVPNQD